MDASSKGKTIAVPFQTITRNRSRAALLSTPMPSPVVIVKKLSPSQYTKNSPPNKKKKISPKSSPDGSAVKINDESKRQEDSAFSCPPSTSKSDKSSPAPKKGRKKTVPTKTTSAIAKKKMGRPKMANRTKSKTSHSSSDQACKGSRSCEHCKTKDETISYLQSRVRFLEVEEASMLRWQPVCEGFCFPFLRREEENRSLMMEKYISQEKLDKAEAEFQDYVQNEDDEIKMLKRKKKHLKKKLSDKMDLCEKDDAEGKEEIKRIKERVERYKEMEAESKLEIAELEKELVFSEKNVEEAREKWRLRPIGIPTATFEGTCDICIDLYNGRKGSKIMLAKVKEENLAVKQQVFDSVVKLKDNACDIAHLSYEIEYIKKRMCTQHLYEKNEEYAGGIDFYDRKDFSVQICNMMEKNFCSRKYRPVPTSAYPFPKTEFENEIEDLQEDGCYICCHKFETPICRRFFCGRVKNKVRMTEYERAQYEITYPAELQVYPGRIETEQGKKKYIDEVVQLIFDGASVEKIASIK